MKTSIYWLSALTIILGTTYLSMHREEMTTAKVATAREPVISNSQNATMVASVKRDLRLSPGTTTDPGKFQIAETRESKSYDGGNPADRDELAASLRANGMKEEDILAAIRPTAPEETDEQSNVGEAKAITFNLGNPADRERMAENLRAQGMKEDQVQQLLMQHSDEQPPDGEKGSAVETQSYDMGDPAQREQVTAALKADGLSEADLRNIPGSSDEITSGAE